MAKSRQYLLLFMDVMHYLVYDLIRIDILELGVDFDEDQTLIYKYITLTLVSTDDKIFIFILLRAYISF